MKKKLPLYKVIYDEDDFGLAAISFVDVPAIEKNFIYFNNEKQVLKFASDNEKRIVVSPVLIPNQKIYRIKDDYEFLIEWDEKTIEDVCVNFILNQRQNNVTVMHPTFTNDELDYSDVLEQDIYCNRVWLVDDEEEDDINKIYGFDVPKGTMCIEYKVHNDEVWNKIKSGELKGLSIEAFMTIMDEKIEVEMNKINNNNNNMAKVDFNKEELSWLKKMVLAFKSIQEGIDVAEEVKEDDKTDSGVTETIFKVKNDLTDSGFDEVKVTQDGKTFNKLTNEVLVKGEYVLEDGNILVIGDDGLFVETKPADTENKPAENIEANIAQEKEEKEEEEVIQLEKITVGETEYEVDPAIKAYIDELVEKLDKNIKIAEDLRSKLPSANPIGKNKVEQTAVKKTAFDFIK